MDTELFQLCHRYVLEPPVFRVHSTTQISTPLFFHFTTLLGSGRFLISRVGGFDYIDTYLCHFLQSSWRSLVQ